MSTRVPYDPALFLLERAEVVSARLGELILGESRLGAAASAWVPVPMATFTLSEGYTVDDNGTLISDSQTATVALSFWDDPGAVLYPADRVRASYDGKVLFLGTVDTTSLAYETTPEAQQHGATRRVTFTATLVGTYAAALGKTVCWTALPAEPPITRIRRWITVNGWS
jgi:hypothetical protein